jgi:hypothetical protein
MDNGWSLSLIDIPLTEFNKSIVQYPNIERFPGGASNDMIPNLQNPKNPLPTIRLTCQRPEKAPAERTGASLTRRRSFREGIGGCRIGANHA